MMISTLCFTNDNKKIISGHDDGNIKLWDV